MSGNALKVKSFVLSVRTIGLYQYLTTHRQEYTLSKQLLHSGTSIGAMIREAEYAETSADFIHIMAIAQKEANKSLYWLELLEATDYPTAAQSLSLQTDVIELLKLLTSMLKTAKDDPKQTH